MRFHLWFEAQKLVMKALCVILMHTLLLFHLGQKGIHTGNIPLACQAISWSIQGYH